MLVAFLPLACPLGVLPMLGGYYLFIENLPVQVLEIDKICFKEPLPSLLLEKIAMPLKGLSDS
jgi:hypothetical protein